MILIITHKEDYTSDFVINKLNEQEIAYFRLNCEDILTYDFKINEFLNFSINGIDSFKSIWFRRTKLANFSSYSIEQQDFLQNEYDSFLKNLFSILYSQNWLSNPNNVYIAENKLLQLKIARSIGFLIPKTLVTTDRKYIKKFYNENNGQTILKPFWNSKMISEGKMKLLFTNLLSKNHIDQIDELEISPTIFQDYIEKKKEYRVTIVDKNIFVASVNSQSDKKTIVDWRRGNLTFKKDELPIEIKKKCFELVNRLGLNFGAIDLIQDKDDNIIFIEINPNGQWVWIEIDTGLEISKSIINYLMQ